MDDFEKNLKIGFLEEALQITSEMESCLLFLENHPNDEGNFNTLLRLAHNFKGSAMAVGFTELSLFVHEIENVLIKIKKAEIVVERKIVSLLLQMTDFAASHVNVLKNDFNARADFKDLIHQAQDLVGISSPSSGPQDSDGIEMLQDPEEGFLSMSEMAAFASADESVRVGLSKVEKLINYVGEMVIIQSVLEEQALQSNSPALKKTVHMLSKVSKEIQDISMGLRMTPVKTTFQKMARVVRDTAESLGKEVQLILEGEETELDKTVLEKINDPLVHLMRNSVDHGIESSEVRAARNKPVQGLISLKAFHKAGRLIIEASDDGGGLDPQKLISKGIEKGLVKPGVSLSKSEAFELIFEPGFSTKEQVSDISGRGVGMDVVKTNFTSLGGAIEIQSEVGQGTTFTISLPLTLAIVESLLVSYSGQRFVIPLSHIYETIPTKDHTVTYATGVGNVLLLRGENLRLFRLGDFFAVKSKRPSSDLISIVVRSGPEPFALQVDDIIGQHQVVVKRLTPDLAGLTAVSGTTILSDGKPALILEPADLLKRKVISGYEPAKSELEGRSA